MDIKSFINRTQNILLEPKREFIRISNENNKPVNVFLNHTLPFLVIYAFAAYLGKIINNPDSFNDAIGEFIKNVLLIFGVIIIGIYLTSAAINELRTPFKSKKDLNKTFALVTYSFTPIFIAIILSSIIPGLSSFIYLIGLYSIILFWISASAIIDIKKEHRQIFIPLSLLSVILIFFLIRIFLGLFFLL